MTRSWWDDDFGYPIMLGSGSMHDLRDADAEPKLWRCKSVSRAAAIALNHDKPTTTSGPLGFRTGRTR